MERYKKLENGLQNYVLTFNFNTNVSIKYMLIQT